MKAVSIILNTTHGPVRVVSCYQSTRAKLNIADLAAIAPQDEQVIAIGDFNAKFPVWNSRTINPNRRVLLEYLETAEGGNTTPVGPEEPTWFAMNRRSDVIDIALLTNVAMAHEIQTEIDGSSDHNPILLTLGEQEGNQEDIIIRKDVNWERYRALLKRDLPPIRNLEEEEDIEAVVENLERAILRAIDGSTTTRRIARRPNLLENIPEETMDLIRRRRTARRRAIRTRFREHKHAFNQLTRRVKVALEEEWRRNLEEINPGDAPMWRIQKALRQNRKPMPSIHGESGIVHTLEEKAEAFADSLELQCKENQLDDEDEDWVDEVNRRARKLRHTQEE